MLRWLVVGLLIATLILLAFTTGWWLTPLLAFVGANTDLIQGLTDLVQLLLWLGAAAVAVMGWLFGRRQGANAQDGGITVAPTGDHSLAIGRVEHFTINQGQADHTHLRINYLNRLYEQCQRLSMAGIDPKAAANTGETLTLDAIYTALLTSQSEQETASRFTPDKQTRLSALDQLNRHEYLVLRGQPGSGKSVFVNFVAMCLAGEQLVAGAGNRPYLNLQALTAPLPDDDGEDQAERQTWAHGALLPIRVILRDFVASPYFPPSEAEAQAEQLWRFIETDLGGALREFSPALKSLVSQKPSLLLLDGLDEVPDAGERRQRLKAVILDFKACYPTARILVTSRIYAYRPEQNWLLPEFEVATLAPFSRGQMIRFVERWYAQTVRVGRREQNDARGRAELLKREIFRNPRLYELAESPLLLTLIASLHDWRSGKLPDEREKLYEEAVELLLDTWEMRKVKRDQLGQLVQIIEPSLSEYLNVTKKMMRSYLEQVAFEAHRDQDQAQAQQTADIPQETLITGLIHLSDRRDLKPRLLADYLSRRSGLLPERRDQIHSFPHRTFQEYLAACYLNRDCYPDKVADLARQDPNRWREVAVLAGLRAAATTESPLWDLAEALCQAEPPAGALAPSDRANMWGAQLAGQGLAEAGSITLPPQRSRYQQRLKRITNWLVYILEQATLPVSERALAGDSLARLGDPRPGLRLGSAGLPDIEWCAVPPGPFLMGSDPAKDSQAYEDEQPQHTVDLPGYLISRHPITQAQFAAFVAAGGYRQPDYWPEAAVQGFWQPGQVQNVVYYLDDDKQLQKELRGWRDRPYDFGPPYDLANHPVVGVTWYEALAFCRWLTDRWQAAGLLPLGWQVCLPSEAEWEKAARGGLKIPTQPVIEALPALDLSALLDLTGFENLSGLMTNPHPHRRYPWGNEPDPNRANYDQTGIGTTSAVGCFPGGASPYGCQDMSGNAWEWTRSLWGKNWQKTDYGYPYRTDDDRENLDVGTDVPRVLRGGSFYYNEGNVRAAIRLRNLPDYWNDYYGFRVCVVASLF